MEKVYSVEYHFESGKSVVDHVASDSLSNAYYSATHVYKGVHVVETERTMTSIDLTKVTHVEVKPTNRPLKTVTKREIGL